MQKEFFQELQDILYEKNITIKFHSFQNFYEDFKSHKFIFNHDVGGKIKFPFGKIKLP